MVDPQHVMREFEAAFHQSPRLYRAPGRVNLIGEHTDYNDGFVMPMALDRFTWVAAAPRSDGALVVRSREYGETVTIFDTFLTARGAPPPRAEPQALGPGWTSYVCGVASILGVSGADMLIASDVPMGAGLSSSAALEVACGYALLDLAGQSIDRTLLARACQRAEHEFAGTRCGIMDQMIACYGQAGHALMIDTRSLARRLLPVPPGVRVVVCNTMVKHELAGSEYNARRADCEAGVAVLARRFPDVRALRDATLAQLETVRGEMSDRVYRRCRHVITENARVEEAARALGAGDLVRVGQLMAESHRSLRDDYDVSCAELDAMVTAATDLANVYGARMTGGGFGGCAIALVDAPAAEQAAHEIARRYEASTSVRPDVWICAAGDGVGMLEALHHGGHRAHGDEVS